MLKNYGNIIKGLAFLLVLGLAFSCSDSSTSPDPPEPPPSCEDDNSCEEDDDSTDTGNEYNYQSEYAYNLNVIYFVPTDVNPRPNYHERLSKLLLFYQDYYKRWMEFWGYKDQTFGLLKDEEAQRVKIIKIEAKHPVSYYPNDHKGSAKGGRRARKEIKDYFAKNPDEKTSNHFFVYMPRPEPKPVAGLPYYGLGRWAFVVDKDQVPSEVEHTTGGDAHELGHALNLPHNANFKTRKNSIGTALMNNGNHVWNHGPGSSATSLTELDAEVLNVNQVTSKEKGNFYGKTDVQFTAVKGHYHNGNIIVSGTFTTDVSVNSVFGVFDPQGRGPYDRVAVKSPVLKTAGADSFHVSIPTNDLDKNKNAPYTLSLWLIHENGSRSSINLPDFKFSNGVPDIDFNLGAIPTLPKTNWAVTDFSDQATESGKLAKNIIDSDFGTWWHSAWVGGNDPHPHMLTVDMGQQESIQGFQFVQAPQSKWRSRIKRMELKVSNDGANWTSLGKFKLPNTKLPQNIELSDKRNFRYFKILTLESWKGPSWNASSLAEVGVF